MSSDKTVFSELRRNRFDIYAEILDFCIVPQVKTRVMHNSHMSFKMMTEYLLQLKFFGFIETSQGSGKFVTTAKGIEYLKRWAYLQELLCRNQNREKRLIRGYHNGILLPF